MKMKKFFVVFLALILVLAMAACKKTEVEVEPTVPNSEIENPVEESTEPVTEAPTEPQTEPTIPEHECAYSEEVVEVTCEEDGYTIHKCTICEQTYNDNYVEALGHDWKDWEVVTEATETAEGTEKRTCVNCNETEERKIAKTIPDHTHKYVEGKVVEATCSKNGSKTYNCSCGASYTEKTAKLAHKYEDRVVNPTCKEKGYTVHTCSVCKYSYTDKYVSATGHDFEEKVTAEPTCKKVGTKIKTCKVCKHTETEEIKKLPHDYKETVVKPTCTGDGYTKYECSCGEKYTDKKVAATGHDWGKWTVVKEATTTEEGKEERTCATCKTKETRSIPKIIPEHKHSYTESVTKQPTCTAVGVKTFKCSCGHTYTEDIAKVDHTYKTAVTAPTCTEKGYTTYTCSVCKTSYKADYTNAAGHNYKESVTKNPTCTAEGTKQFKCDACGDSYNESIAKIDHAYSASSKVDPTCTKGGYTIYKCGSCGTTKQGDETPAVGHKNTDVVTKPTCTEKGYTTHTCKVCGATSKDSETPATGHDYKTTSNTATCTKDGKKTEECKTCGHTKTSDTKATGHVNTKEEKKSASCVSDGYEKVICQDCGTTVSEKTIPSNGKHSMTTMKLSAAADKFSDYSSYGAFKEHTIELCEHCGYGDLDTISCVYSKSSAASTMLGYVNGLRESVYGTSDYNLVLDSRLVEVANIRAKEISTNYSHAGMRECSAENIGGGTTLYSCYSKWNNSSGHRDNMIDQSFKYFGFGWYFDIYTTQNPFAVQLFK